MSEPEPLETPAQKIERLEKDNERLEAEVKRLRRGIELVAVDFDNANVELAGKRRQITELKKQIVGSTTDSDVGDRVTVAFRYWQLRCGHPRAQLDHKRAKVLEAMIRRHDEVPDEDGLQEVMRAIDGARFDAFVGPNGVRHDGLPLICRDEDSFDRFRGRWRSAVTHGPLSRVLTDYCLPAGVVTAPYVDLEHVWSFKCPVCRAGWAHEDFMPLRISKAELYCEAVCTTIDAGIVRAALLEHFPQVVGPPPKGDGPNAIPTTR